MLPLYNVDSYNTMPRWSDDARAGNVVQDQSWEGDDRKTRSIIVKVSELGEKRVGTTWVRQKHEVMLDNFVNNGCWWLILKSPSYIYKIREQ